MCRRLLLLAVVATDAVAPRLVWARDPHLREERAAAMPQHLHAIGPSLVALPKKLADPRWLLAWLQNPGRLRGGSLMRNFNLSPTEAQAVAAYLYADDAPAPTPVAWRGGDPRIGKRLFVARGCRGCHAIGAEETFPTSRAPNLSGLGVKVRGAWLFQWLKSPRSYDPNTPMPKLALSDADIRHLVAFLMSQKQGAAVVAKAPAFNATPAPEVARAAIIRFDCTKCHVIRGFQTIEPIVGWSAIPRSCVGCHEPGGSAPPGSEGLDAAGRREARLRIGRLLVEYYNCLGCHPIEGRGGEIARYLERKTLVPPSLEGEGARVQTSWLVDYLQDPKPLRPWLQMRMPAFSLSKGEATALADYFAAVAGVEAVDERSDQAQPKIVQLGSRRFAHFKCVQCHPTAGDPVPENIEVDDLSIDLTLAKRRLRPSWVREFLARPKALVGTATRMPAVFYTTDGIPKVDHPERDINAVTEFLLHMSPTTGLASGAGQPDGHKEPTPVDWTTYRY